LKCSSQVHTNPSEFDQVSSVRSMASSISVKAEDRLEGASNFNVWKLKIMNILQEHDLEQYVTTVVGNPPLMQEGWPSRRVKQRPRESSLTQSKTV
jgi:hypothetical protein